MSTDTDERPYTKAEAADLLGISERTLNRYAKEGLIAIVYHAGAAWVTRDAVADYWARLSRSADQRRAAAEKRARRK